MSFNYIISEAKTTACFVIGYYYDWNDFIIESFSFF